MRQEWKNLQMILESTIMWQIQDSMAMQPVKDYLQMSGQEISMTMQL